MTAEEIEIKLVRHLNPRRQLIVPNVSWGFELPYEIDVAAVSEPGRNRMYEAKTVAVSSRNYLTEYEIKTSLADLKREWKKARWNNTSYRRMFEHTTRRYFIAMPAGIAEAGKELIPEDVGAGVIAVNGGARVIFPARINRKAAPLSDKRVLSLARLGALKYWGLKGIGYGGN